MNAIVGLSITGAKAPLTLLERLALRSDEAGAILPELADLAGVSQLTLLSTCQRVEMYSVSAPDGGGKRLLKALAAHRGIPLGMLEAASTVLSGEAAVRHLLRVAGGLESFVLGETEIVGQVRSAAQASRTAGVSGAELDRLFGTAVRAARRVQCDTSFAAAGRSVAGAAVDAVVESLGQDLTGRRVLVVGSGQVAAVAVARAREYGAQVTVANRTRRHAERFAEAGARVVDLGQLGACLTTTDVAILATASPEPLIDPALLVESRGNPPRPLLLVDLCLPRNVAPSVRELSSVRLLDLANLADLRGAAAIGASTLVSDVTTAERLIEDEVARYLSWLAARSAAEAVKRLRTDAEAVVQEEARRVQGRLPVEVQAVVEQALSRTVHRLAHGPTLRLLAAAEQGDDDLVGVLAGLFDRSSRAASWARG
jgi:glutamyl-tRNA reductase